MLNYPINIIKEDILISLNIKTVKVGDIEFKIIIDENLNKNEIIFIGQHDYIKLKLGKNDS